MDWYYLGGDKRFGPVGDDAVKALIAAKVVTSTTSVWRAGRVGWDEAGRTELAQLLGAVTPTAAPVAPRPPTAITGKGELRTVVLLQAGQELARIELSDQPLVIGKADECDVAVDDSSVSCRHARLSLVGGRVCVEDLGSTNGTFVNGQAAEGVQPLKSGDLLRMADWEIEVRLERQRASSPISAQALKGQQPASKLASTPLPPAFAWERLSPMVVCCLGFGCLPSVLPIAVYFITTPLLPVAMLAVPSLMLAVLSICYFIRPARFPRAQAMGALLFTMFVGIQWMLKFEKIACESIESPEYNHGVFNVLFKVIGHAIRDADIDHDGYTISLGLRYFGYIVGVGLCEEMTKLLPLIFLIFLIGRKGGGRAPLDYRSFLVVGFFSGLGFGIGEAVLRYSPWSGDPTVTGNITRWFACVPSHAIYTVIDSAFLWVLAPFIIKAKGIYKPLGLCALAVSVAAVLHGTYDVLCSSSQLMGVILDWLSIVLMFAVVRFVAAWSAPDSMATPVYDGNARGIMGWVQGYETEKRWFWLMYVFAGMMILAALYWFSCTEETIQRVLQHHQEQQSAYQSGLNGNDGLSAEGHVDEVPAPPDLQPLAVISDDNRTRKREAIDRFETAAAEGAKTKRWETVYPLALTVLSFDANYIKAQMALGKCYFTGQGVERDYAEAIIWYRKAAEQGDADSQLDLGSLYYYGEGVAQDYTEAVKWYRMAAEQGDDNAQTGLGACYFNGYGVSQDYAEAVRCFYKAAENGNAAAQYNLGRSYYSGQGVVQDYEEAAKWYRKAAEQGNAEAQYILGICNLKGQGVERDTGEAMRWLRKAADYGNAEAQYTLGCSYGSGDGVARDDVEAARWFRKSAEQGLAVAQYGLGMHYYSGRGVEQDYAESYKWTSMAAAQGQVDAQYALGCYLADGQGVKRDHAEAARWWRKAAEQGNAAARKALEETGK